MMTEAFQIDRIDHPLAALIPLAQPLLNQAHERVLSVVQELAGRSGGPEMNREFLSEVTAKTLANLAIALFGRIGLTELQEARRCGHLSGSTPEERYQDFVRRALDPELSTNLLKRYPLLQPAMTHACTSRADALIELLRRLHADWDVLCARFPQAAAAGSVTALNPSCGDLHRSGRAVAVLGFASRWQLVYKPRPLAVEAQFQRLLEWANLRGASPHFATVNFSDRGRYGWMEHVSPAQCESRASVARFYERLGGQLALLHVLAGIDIHRDNLIAHGEHPVLIDLEALFHPGDADLGSGTTDDAFGSSVLRVGLLPVRTGTSSEGAWQDGAGIGADIDEPGAGVTWSWEHVGTDNLQLTLSMGNRAVMSHHPVLNGNAVAFRSYLPSLLSGFDQIGCLLLRHRDELLAETGPIYAFRNVETRVIVRPTDLYARMLAAASQPDTLSSVGGRDALLTRLERMTRKAPALAGVVAAEQRDLAAGDVPLFTTRPDSRDIWTSDGTRLSKVLANTGLTVVRERIDRLSKAEIARQRWCIEASYALGDQTPHLHAPGRRRRAVSAVNLATDATDAVLVNAVSETGWLSRTRLLNSVNAIGDRVQHLAFDASRAPSWIVPTLDTNGDVSLSTAGPSLYDGTLGIGLFQLYLGAVTGKPQPTKMALRTIQTTMVRLQHNPSALRGVGAFTGWGGVLYVLAHVSAVSKQDWKVPAGEAIGRLTAELADDRQFDVVSGAAGAVLGLLAFHQIDPCDRVLNAAIKAGDHLLACASSTDPGIGWTLPEQTAPLSGLAHGAAGIALALQQLWRASGEPRFGRAVQEALLYERSLFSAKDGNWLDLRHGRPSYPSFATSWCHGAVGIGLSRLEMFEPGLTMMERSEIDAALASSVFGAPGSRQSLCHGDIGTIMLLLEAALRLRQSGAIKQLQLACTALFDKVADDGWNGDALQAVVSPELMTGLSGIGYGILRLLAPGRVPSLLTLAGPLPSRWTSADDASSR